MGRLKGKPVWSGLLIGGMDQQVHVGIGAVVPALTGTDENDGVVGAGHKLMEFGGSPGGRQGRAGVVASRVCS